MNFETIEYLRNGTPRQRQAYATLSGNKILAKLKQYDPLLVGTIPINIDIESSDLDIICCFADKSEFIQSIENNFDNEAGFAVRERETSGTLSVVANFRIDDFGIEIFGQAIPTKQQFAYRHMIAEYKLLNTSGEEFRQRIIELKRQGHKTEPAFWIALGLTGDPYLELLKFEELKV